MKTSFYKEDRHEGHYAMIIIDLGESSCELNEDEILELYNELGSLCAKIQQRRADEKRKARSNEKSNTED